VSQKKTRHLIFYHNCDKSRPIFKILSLLVDMPYTSFCRHSVVTLALETSSFQRGRIPILSAENSKSVSTLKSQSASQKSCYCALCG